MSAASASILLVDVAQRDDLDRGDLDEAEQVALAVPAAADEPDAQRLLGGADVVAEGGQGQARRRPGLEELAAVHGHGSGRRARRIV